MIFRLTVTKVVFEFIFFNFYPFSKIKINSNKGCFWIDENNRPNIGGFKINSNKGCFWIISLRTLQHRTLWLTVTKVVFELAFFTHFTCRIMINSNKGCFWIGVQGLSTRTILRINSNKGCFWIMIFLWFKFL